MLAGGATLLAHGSSSRAARSIDAGVPQVHLTVLLSGSTHPHNATLPAGAKGANLTKFTQRRDGEGFAVPSGAVFRLACCDCGLVHDVVLVSEDNKPVGIAAARNHRATRQRRRSQTVKGKMT